MTITVTPEQVRAAQIEVAAFRSAGLEPDPLVVKMANATVVDKPAHRERRDER